MKTLQSEVSNLPSSGGLNRRMLGLMLGALVLGSTLGSQAFAQPGPQHGQHRDHADRHDRGDRGYRHDRGARHVHGHQAPNRVIPGPRFSPPPVVVRAPAHLPPAQSYRFRAADRTYLQRHYHSSLRWVRADRRPHFAPGHAIPFAYRSHVTVLPRHLRHQLPPPPRGYQVGYYQGYSVVYDPVTFTILSVLDLLTR